MDLVWARVLPESRAQFEPELGIPLPRSTVASESVIAGYLLHSIPQARMEKLTAPEEDPSTGSHHRGGGCCFIQESGPQSDDH